MTPRHAHPAEALAARREAERNAAAASRHIAEADAHNRAAEAARDPSLWRRAADLYTTAATELRAAAELHDRAGALMGADDRENPAKLIARELAAMVEAHATACARLAGAGDPAGD